MSLAPRHPVFAAVPLCLLLLLVFRANAANAACNTGKGALILGTAEDHILQVGQFGTQFTPDINLTYRRQPDDSFRIWLAAGTAVEAGDTFGFTSNDFFNLTPMTLSGGNAVASLGPSGPGTANFDADYAGPGTVFPASNGTDLLMIYHAENHEFAGVHYSYLPYYASLGLARSTDNGLTWTRVGQIVTGIAPHPTTYPPRAALGAGIPSAIIANGYIYVFYIDWSFGLGYPDALHVARAPVSSDGAPGSWQKYYAGSFSQPGIGGLSTPVQGPPAPASLTVIADVADVSYNTFLQSYLMLFETANGWYYSTSPDLVNWTVQGEVFNFPSNFINLQTGDTWYVAATLISPEQVSEQTTSCSGYIYYAKGVWNVTPHTMYRLPFSFQLLPTATSLLSATDPAVSGNAVNFTATVSAADQFPLTGTVNFSATGPGIVTPQSNVALSNGSAVASLIFPVSGVYAVQAAYSGDSNHGATTASLAQIVNCSTCTGTVTTAQLLSVSPFDPGEPAATVRLKQSLAINIIVSGTVSPVGNVQIEDNGALSAPVPLKAAGSASSTATIILSNLTLGTHQIIAIYGGSSPSFAGSLSSPMTLQHIPKPH